MIETIKKEEVVNNSNQPQTITEKVVRDLKQHISKVNDLIEKVTENEYWDYHQFSNHLELEFEDLVNVEQGVTPQQIKNWFDLQDYDFEPEFREESEEEWNDNWMEIVTEHVGDYDPDTFYFIGENYVENKVRCDLDDYIKNSLKIKISKGKL